MINLDPLRPYADLIRWGLIAALAVPLVVLGYRWGASHWQGKYEAEAKAHTDDNAAHAATLQGLADATAAVAAKAKAASQTLATSRQENDTRYQEALKDAKRAKGDLAAALRRGDVQLQPQWSCTAPGTGTGGAAPNAVQASAAGRFNSAARIVAAGDADAAVIDWLWSGWKADRDAVIAAGCAVETAR
ncbi:hypothetical protein [Stenotrophomonas humi]|uniref:hypothetical protein n=1 Tax=Stenotrophomonas humi TaxID=405444 RepID=UPI00070FDE65|nr:hypothetical protein [Stenotrophomonas humi]